MWLWWYLFHLFSHFISVLACSVRLEKMLEVLFCTMDNEFPFSICHTLLGWEFDFDSCRGGNFWDFVWRDKEGSVLCCILRGLISVIETCKSSHKNLRLRKCMTKWTGINYYKIFYFFIFIRIITSNCLLMILHCIFNSCILVCLSSNGIYTVYIYIYIYIMIRFSTIEEWRRAFGLTA
jgi:hypothetical protein